MEPLQICKSQAVHCLCPKPGNARNSEGDFARLRDGRILFAYSRYNGESAHDDATCDIAALYSYDDGAHFTEDPVILVAASEHNTLNLMSVSLLRLQSGRLALFYLCKVGPYSEFYMRLANEDETAFGEAVKCFPSDEQMYYVVNNARVIQLSDGRLLIPAARHCVRKNADGSEHGEYFAKARVFGSDDEGKTWKAVSGLLAMPHPGYSATGLQEPGLVALADGRIYQYFRTDRMFQYESFSEDAGQTWSVPIASRFTAPESPMLIRRNPYDGRYYAFWNPIPLYNGRIGRNEKWVHAGRTPFVMAVSEDGIDFSEYTVIENEPDHGYCYPAVFFLSEKKMLLSYCSGGPEDGMCLTKTTLRLLEING